MKHRLIGPLLALGALFTAATTSNGDDSMTDTPLCISGIRPSLTVYNRPETLGDTRYKTGGGEVGIGAVVPWAGKLWMVTYPQHDTRGGSDKLWTVDEDFAQEMRPESVGGTHANRMIHRESNQLIIGVYFIDAKGNVRAADVNQLVGRMTATARHLTDPANMVYFYDMEGAVYEVDVHSLEVTKLFEKPVPGWHGKGAYTAQGRFIVANNGERNARSKHDGYGGHLKIGGSPVGEEIGVLAEWDGGEWRIIERKQFLDITGPGGITGSPDDDAPAWAIGWDRRSVILKLLDSGVWSTYRLPKATHTYDPRHGWYTEWPRIREVADGRWMMDMSGMFYDFPPEFRAGRTGGIRPIASHLRYIPDFCEWNGQVVLAADDASTMKNPFAGQPQSNIWIGSMKQIEAFGPRTGWGGPWVGDEVKASAPSDPFLIDGFERRCLHLAVEPIVIEAQPAATDPWRKGLGVASRVTGKYPFGEIPDALARMARVTIDRGDFHQPAPGYGLDVDQDVVIYLAVDARGDCGLGDDWKLTEMTLKWGGKYSDTVWKRSFRKGRVEVPGNDCEHTKGSFGMPHTAFVEPVSGRGEEVEISGLTGGIGAEVSPSTPETGTESTVPEDKTIKVRRIAFTLEVDAKGDGVWKKVETVAIKTDDAGVGYRRYDLPTGLKASWMRVTADADCKATAYFHFTTPRADDYSEGDRLIASLADADETSAMNAGLIRPAKHNTSLQFLARRFGADGKGSDPEYIEINLRDNALNFARPDESRADEVVDICEIKRDFEIDDASVIMTWKGQQYRLPKGVAAYDEPFAFGWPRGVREVQSERNLANIHGTFYEIPRDDGVPKIKPVSTHGKAIMDFCSWRGLLVISGARKGAKADGNLFTDGEVGLWFGAVDDLWRFGKPVGVGGPWKHTSITAGQASDPYLITGYDQKRLEISHDAKKSVTFTVEIDVAHNGWLPYETFKVKPGWTLKHEFDDDFSAHWVRLKADKDCAATAMFVYE